MTFLLYKKEVDFMKNFKSQNGSATLYVLIAMLFMVVYLVGLYAISSNSEVASMEEVRKNKTNL